jgi:hypothetical protein
MLPNLNTGLHSHNMCEVHRKGFCQLLSDNDEMFLSYVSAAIESVDEYATLEVTKCPQSYHFRLVSSLPMYNEMLLQEILKLHNFFKLRIDLSKSIKASGTINFNLPIN